MKNDDRITPEELDAIEARAKAATPGKWVSDDYAAMVRAENPYSHGDMHVADIRGWGHLTGRGACAMSEEKAFAVQLENAAFIAAARADVPRLVAEVRRLTAESKKGVAYWENSGFDDMCCSNCGRQPDHEPGSSVDETAFCPHCGYRMTNGG